jgi:hypothetical protein
MNKHPILRPDITEYRPYVELLQDTLNEEALFKMSMKDVILILIEQAVSKLHPDVEVNRTRKAYQILEF